MDKKTLFGYKSNDCGKLFLLCWIAYFATYICRLNFSAVMPELSANGVFSQDKIASVSSAFFICYGIGQVVSGNLGDKISPKTMIFCGLGISGICNILIFFFHKIYAVLLILWAINGAVQSMVWTPILRTAGDYFDSQDRDKFGVDIATTVPLGTLASYAISLLILLFAPWEYVFLVCGGVVVIFAAIWFFGTKKLFVKLQKTESDEDDSQPKTEKMKMKPLLKLICVSFVIVMFIPIAIQGTLKDSVTQWIPTYLNNQYNTGSSVSLALTMILPIINVTGAWFSKAVNKKLKNELSTSAVFFGIAALFLVVLMIFGTKNIVISLICMAGVTNCMFAINVMTITMMPLKFSKYGRTSTVGGTVNSVAYIGCGLLNMGAGALLEKTGSAWRTLFMMWLALAVAAVVFSVICAARWQKCIKKGGILAEE